MKFNKWTLGLAALGVVSLSSAAKAEEKMTAIQSALSATSISGYVDVSAQWNIGKQAGSGLPPYSFGGASKADGFNLNVVQLTIDKPLDESEWASGYRADLWFGPDANALGSTLFGASGYTHGQGSGDVAIRQAYVALRAPVGNGLDFKVGVFDTVVGYETLESGNNPNMTRSYGFTIEPTTHTGILATYRFSDSISAAFGVADTYGSTINARTVDSGGTVNESRKTYMGSLALTAPQDWGWAAGSSLYFGVINGFNASRATAGAGIETHWYAGATLATPVTGLKVGASFDYQDARDTSGTGGDNWVVGGYASYQATEKLSFHARGEYGHFDTAVGSGLPTASAEGLEATATIQYDLWQNVISRLEFRWDHSEDLNAFGQFGNLRNAYLLAANFIYKF